MENEKPILQMEGISVNRHNRNLIDDISLCINVGEVYGIVSTQSFALEMLLSVLNDEISISDMGGKIYYMEKQITPHLLHGKENSISVIAEKDYLYPSFSAYDNIFFFSPEYVHGRRVECQKKCKEFSAKYNIHIDFSKKVSELSLEERKLVEIIRAYMNRSRIIVMYDTITRIENNFSTQFLSVLEDLKKKGTSIIYLTTQISDALNICDRFSIFTDGRIQATVTQKEGRENPQRLLSILSGAVPLIPVESNIEEELMTVISTAREIMSTQKDMRKMLEYLAQNLKRIKKAQSCMIYVIDERDNLVFSSGAEANAAATLKSEDIPVLAEKADDTLLCFKEGDREFTDYFFGTNVVKRIYCYCAPVRYAIKTLVQLTFDSEERLDDQDVHILDTFIKEIKLSIESSLILEHSSLLQESHHRIKNNLQSVISLIYMQKYNLGQGDSISRQECNDALDSIINRIKSIAAIHDLLSKDRFGWKNIDLTWITGRIMQFYNKFEIKSEINMEGILIPYSKATSFALLINELVNNCVKHAFNGMMGEKKLHISCATEQNMVHLVVADNGVGLPESFTMDSGTGIGMTIIRSIAQELSAEIKMYSDSGTIVEMKIPIDLLYRI